MILRYFCFLKNVISVAADDFCQAENGLISFTDIQTSDHLLITTVWSVCTVFCNAFYDNSVSGWWIIDQGLYIIKTCLYSFDPLEPHFYTVKLGFTLIFLFLLRNIHYGYSLKPPRRWVLTSTHSLCFEQKYENYQDFSSESFHFLVVKFSVYLNRCVLVMNLSMLGKNFSRRHLRLACWVKISANNILKYFSQKIGFDISCK